MEPPALHGNAGAERTREREEPKGEELEGGVRAREGGGPRAQAKHLCPLLPCLALLRVAKAPVHVGRSSNGWVVVGLGHLKSRRGRGPGGSKRPGQDGLGLVRDERTYWAQSSKNTLEDHFRFIAIAKKKKAPYFYLVEFLFTFIGVHSFLRLTIAKQS
jgi:hypothetical protein